MYTYTKSQPFNFLDEWKMKGKLFDLEKNEKKKLLK